MSQFDPPRRKRKPSFHQKRLWRFTLFFGALAVIMAVGIIWLLNQGRRLGH